MLFKRIHHIAFAVRDLEAAILRFERLIGCKVSERGRVSNREAEVAIFKLGDMNLEIVAPTSDASSVKRFIDEHGEGFFHLAFAVSDVDEGARLLQQRGIKMLAPPHVAYKDWRIAYISPEETGGIYAHIIDDKAL